MSPRQKTTKVVRGCLFAELLALCWMRFAFVQLFKLWALQWLGLWRLWLELASHLCIHTRGTPSFAAPARVRPLCVWSLYPLEILRVHSHVVGKTRVAHTRNVSVFIQKNGHWVKRGGLA